MLNVFWFKLKDFRQTLPMIAGMTILALVLIGVFGMSFNSTDQPDVQVVDLDSSHVSAAYLESLYAYGGFDFIQGSREDGMEAVSKGRAIAAVVIEEGFGENLADGTASVTMVKAGNAIEQYTLQANLEGAGRSLALEEGFLEHIPGVLASMDIAADPEVLRMELREVVDGYPVMTVTAVTEQGSSAQGYDSLRHSFIGFILFFSMFTMVFGIGSIIEEKENRVWQRQSVAPVSFGKVMAGNLLSTFFVGVAQLLVMIIISRLIFGIDWGGSTAALLLVISSYVAATTAMGLVMSGLVSTSQQLGSFAPIVVVSTSMIGGCMWPLEIISSRMLLFMADMTPQRWAYKGLKAVIINNGNIGDVMDSVIVLWVISGVLFLLGMLPEIISQKTRVFES